MKIEYILKERDFIDYHLFTFSENKRTLLIMNISKLLLVGLFIYYAIDMYNNDVIVFAIILGILAIIILLVYNQIYTSKLKKHYSKIVKDKYAKRFGEKETMEFTPEYIITEEETGEGKTKISEVEKIYCPSN